MGNLTVTADRVSVLYPDKAKIYDRIAAVAITAGAAVALNTAGKAVKADASNANTLVNPGIALNKAGAGQAVSVLHYGHVAGYTLAGDYGAPVYVSDDAGLLADAAGTVEQAIGTIEAIPQADGPVKCLFVDVPWTVVHRPAEYAAAAHTHGG